MKHFLFGFALLVCTAFHLPKDFNNPDPHYPKGYFQSPVAGKIILTGNYGELRANHFHSGIDIKPCKGCHHQAIFAAAEGYVKRVRIEPGGYGQSIYIAHPNGFTTVYAHLDRFASDIQALIRQKQYESESFEQNIELQPTDLPVARGQHIGNMGNRGHSFGEHLHFEIRDTKTENPINPLLFGFDIPDNIPPSVQALKMYFYDEKQTLVDTKIVYPIKKPDGTFGIAGDTLNVPTPYVCFALKSYDKDNDKSGDNGIYSLSLFKNDTTIYQFRTERFAFSETRYLNAHLDFYEQRFRGSYYHRLHLLPGNQLSMYQNVVNRGLVAVQDSAATIKLVSADFQNNGSIVQFAIRRQGTMPAPPIATPYKYVLPYNEPSIIQPEGAVFYFPKNSFYESVYCQFGQVTEGGSAGIYSPTYQLHHNRTPVHAAYTIRVRPVNLPDSLRSKAFVAYCPREGTSILNCGGDWTDDGMLMAKNAVFGNYCIMVDTTPPTIRPLGFKRDMRKASRLAFKINDNYGVIGSGRGMTYRAEVDGIWILMEYDSKSNTLYHTFDGRISNGEHSLKLSVKDGRGNERVFESAFIK
jgi:hypothetical protein